MRNKNQECIKDVGWGIRGSFLTSTMLNLNLAHDWFDEKGADFNCDNVNWFVICLVYNVITINIFRNFLSAAHACFDESLLPIFLS